MSSAKLKQRILDLQQRGRDLLDQLLQIQPLLRGSFTQVYTRCGKPNCWCAHSSRGHPHVRLTWSQSGQLTTRKVPAQAADRVRELTGNYTAPAEASSAWCEMLQGLADFDRDMQEHMYLENQVLFPRALEAQRGRRVAAAG